MTKVEELSPEALYRQIDASQLTFATTAELPDIEEPIGQPRVLEAVRFGMGIRQDGYNIFALGPSGTGKHSLVQHFMEKRAAKEPVPPDLCYVNNFQQQYKPHALRLPPGTGVRLRRDMEKLVKDLGTVLASAFESDEYRARRQVVEHQFKEGQDRALAELQQRAQEKSLALLKTPVGLVFAPVRNNEVIAPEEYQKLPEEERTQIEAVVQELQAELQKILSSMPRAQREAREHLQELDREFVTHAVNPFFEGLRGQYAALPEVIDYLNAAQQDVTENVELFFKPAEAAEPASDGSEGEEEEAEAAAPVKGEAVGLRRYRVNVLVDHSDTTGAPVIEEDNPTYQNLVGAVEHLAQMGALVTDFNLIKPGALHRANGGYLLLDARKVLQQPYAWEGLKRALLASRITIESLGQAMSAISTVSLEPEPVPLQVKVALVGDRSLYYLLTQGDPDFDKLFKVEADFSDEMERTGATQQLYARLIATLARQHQLRALDRAAVARTIERSSRLVGDSEKLTMAIRNVLDVIREADYWAGEAGRDTIGAGDVQRAIDAQIYRADRVREQVQEEIRRGTILIDTTGAVAGQVNGLSVLQLGNFSFGQPSRITARVRLGEGEVVNIEREVEMSGPIHSKGVLILAGFLGARYAADQPLSLSASVVFEQSYGGVEGDSASSAELYALLSAIADVPVRQCFSVTGAVNQYGHVEAIGGVNEKIEGYYDVCKAKGLTGEQGVLIPASNVKHLMLRQDVVDAVRAGRFHIYPVEHVDQGIEILTGAPAGERDEQGRYPEGSINARVQARLTYLAQRRMEFGPGMVGSKARRDTERGAA